MQAATSQFPSQARRPASDSTLTSIVFTAYSVTSAYLSGGYCITNSGSSIPLSSPYSVVTPAASADQNFLNYAGLDFLDYLGFTTCSAGGGEPLVTPLSEFTNSTNPTAPSTASAGPGASTVSPFTGGNVETPPNGLSAGAKIGIGLGIPAFVVSTLLFAFIFWRRSRSAKDAKTSEEENSFESQVDDRPYLQQKAELEDEERRIHEMDGEGKRYELDGEVRCHEMPIVEKGAGGQRTETTMQELRGEEFAKEMEGRGEEGDGK